MGLLGEQHQTVLLEALIYLKQNQQCPWWIGPPAILKQTALVISA